jgi:hypothetical protein
MRQRPKVRLGGFVAVAAAHANWVLNEFGSGARTTSRFSTGTRGRAQGGSVTRSA